MLIKLKKTFLTVWIILSIMVLLGAILLFDGSATQGYFFRGDFFWGKLIYAELLIFAIFFAAWTGFFDVAKQRKFLGAYAILIFNQFLTSVILCFALLIISSILPQEKLYQNLFIVSQMVIWAFFSIVYLVLRISMAGQAMDLAIDEPSVITPLELAKRIQAFEDNGNFSSDEKKALRQLREKLAYSLPGAGKVLQSDKYKALVSQIMDLLSDANKAKAIIESGEIKKITMALVAIE